MPRQAAGEDRHPSRAAGGAAMTHSIAEQFDEMGGLYQGSFCGHRLRMQAAPQFQVFVFIPGKPAGRVGFQQRSCRRLGTLERDVEAGQR